MANIGLWRIDMNGSVETWLTEMKAWRNEHLIRMGYDDAGPALSRFRAFGT